MPFFGGGKSPKSPRKGGTTAFQDLPDPAAGLSPEDRQRHEKDQAALARVREATKDKERARLLSRQLAQLPKSVFLRRKQVSVAVCTWNVAESPAQRVSALEKWLQTKRGVDIIAVGLQEVDMSLSGLATSSTGKSDPWVDCLNRHVIAENFRKVASQSLVGTLIVVFVKADLVRKIENLAVKEVKLGMGGVTGNKGALAVSFQLYCKRFMFINAHFVPHQENAAKRNENYHFVLTHLSHNLEPPRPSVDVCTNLVTFGTTGDTGSNRIVAGQKTGMFGSPKAGSQATVANSLLGITDYLFWFGDLNYRIDTPYEDVMLAIAHKRINNILQGDQLKREMAADRVFGGFTEADIKFLPTYKYVKGEKNYDTSKKGGKPRVPAYTDRVLWYQLKSPKPDDFLPPHSNIVQPVKYNVYHHTVSDHHPVCCVLKCAGYQPDPQALDRIVDMATAGMSPQQITQGLVSELRKKADERELYEPFPAEPEDVSGPGTYYSTDEEVAAPRADLAMEQRQRDKLEDRLAMLENLIKEGPFAGGDQRALDEIKDGQHGLKEKVEQLAAQIVTLPAAPSEEINLIGESMTLVLSRLQGLETFLASGGMSNKEEVGESMAVLRGQFGELAERMDAFASAVTSCVDPPDIESCIPECYKDGEYLDTTTRQERARLRQIFLEGASAGFQYAHETGGFTRQAGNPFDAANPAKQSEREEFFKQREEDLKKLLDYREGELDRREKAVANRESEIAARADALEKLQSVLNEKIEAAEKVTAQDARNHTTLAKYEDEIKDQELRLLQEKAKLSSQQLKLKADIADMEASRESFTTHLHFRENLLTRREGQLDTIEEKLRAAGGWVPTQGGTGTSAYSPRPRSPTGDMHARPPWKGVLEGNAGGSRSPSRVRGAYRDPELANPNKPPQTRSRSPLSDLLLEHSLYDRLDLERMGMQGAFLDRGGGDRDTAAPTDAGRDASPPQRVEWDAPGRRDARSLTPPSLRSPSQARGDGRDAYSVTPMRADDHAHHTAGSGGGYASVSLPPRTAAGGTTTSPFTPGSGARGVPPRGGVPGASPATSYSPHNPGAADRLATLLAKYKHNARLPTNFTRIAPDTNYPGGFLYAFGSRKVTIRLMGEGPKKEPRVLIASGWMPFADFVAKFGDAEQRRLMKSLQFD